MYCISKNWMDIDTYCMYLISITPLYKQAKEHGFHLVGGKGGTFLPPEYLSSLPNMLWHCQLVLHETLNST